MHITTTTDQQECCACLDMLGVREVFRPIPPHVTSDSLMQLDETTWIVGTNHHGKYTLHALEECSKAEAWEFLEKIRGNEPHTNMRLAFVGDNAQEAMQQN
jgi:hypothetical protein